VNSGNIFLWNLPVEISSEALIISNNRITIGVLAPYEKKDIDLIVSSRQKNKKINTSIEILVAGRKEFSEPIVVIPFVYGLTLKISGVVGLVAFLILLVKLYRIFRTHER